jgi:hypothetical protein
MTAQLGSSRIARTPSSLRVVMSLRYPVDGYRIR